MQVRGESVAPDRETVRAEAMPLGVSAARLSARGGAASAALRPVPSVEERRAHRLRASRAHGSMTKTTVASGALGEIWVRFDSSASAWYISVWRAQGRHVSTFRQHRRLGTHAPAEVVAGDSRACQTWPNLRVGRWDSPFGSPGQHPWPVNERRIAWEALSTPTDSRVER